VRSICTLVVLTMTMAGAAWPQAPYHFNIGGGAGWPNGQTSDFASVGGHGVVGGGFTLAPHVGLNGEYMFQDLPVRSTIVSRLAATDASSHLHAITGNLVLAFGGEKLGAYLVGGGGWYKRTWKVTHPVLGTENECDPGLLWFGIFDCHEEIVVRDKTLASGSETAPGWNAGGGVTLSLGRDTSAKLYLEVRYHHANHRGIPTEVLPLTIGIRW
jgi:hypothetical protein